MLLLEHGPLLFLGPTWLFYSLIEQCSSLQVMLPQDMEAEFETGWLARRTSFLVRHSLALYYCQAGATGNFSKDSEDAELKVLPCPQQG